MSNLLPHVSRLPFTHSAYSLCSRALPVFLSGFPSNCCSGFLPSSLSESFFMVKGAALFLQQGNSTQGPRSLQHPHKHAGDGSEGSLLTLALGVRQELALVASTSPGFQTGETQECRCRQTLSCSFPEQALCLFQVALGPGVVSSKGPSRM